LTPADVAGVVGLSTPVDLEPREDKTGFGDALMAGKGADTFSRDAAGMKAARPIRHVTKSLPPPLLVVGGKGFPMLEADTPAVARAFAEKAKGAGRDVATFVGKGCDHMGVVRGLLEDRSPIREQVVAFLRKLEEGGK